MRLRGGRASQDHSLRYLRGLIRHGRGVRCGGQSWWRERGGHTWAAPPGPCGRGKPSAGDSPGPGAV
jgi:hypothetical protein